MKFKERYEEEKKDVWAFRLLSFLIFVVIGSDNIIIVVAKYLSINIIAIIDLNL